MMDIRKTILEAFSGGQEKEGEKDAIALLKADHRKVEELFKQFEECRTKLQKTKVVGQIIAELTVHAAAEEKLIYPLVEKKDSDMSLEAVEEHHLIKILLKELSNFDGSEENFKAKVTVLKEVVEHHVKEEEHELFPKLKEMDTDLMALGEAVQADKDKQVAKLKPAKARTTKSSTAKSRAKSTSRTAARKAS